MNKFKFLIKDYLQNNKRAVIFDVLLVLLSLAVAFLPTLDCNHASRSMDPCNFMLQNCVTRSILAVPIIFIMIIVRSIRTLALFIELSAVTVVFCSGAFLLAYKNYINISSLDFLNNTLGIVAVFGVFITSLLILIFFQKYLSTFKKRLWLYVPIICSEVLITIFAAIIIFDLHPPTPIVAFPSAPSSCFTEGTLVSTPNGLTKIESLLEGDAVYSYDISKGATTTSFVQKNIRKTSNNIILLNKEIEVTPEHPIAILSNNKISWKKAREITMGDCLFSDQGTCIKIESILNKNVPSVTVVNLSVSEPHNFFVVMKDTPVLVHNKSVQFIPAQ